MKSFTIVLKKVDAKKGFMNAKQDRQGDTPAVRDELRGERRKDHLKGTCKLGDKGSVGSTLRRSSGQA
jgi:hypothetical protein